MFEDVLNKARDRGYTLHNSSSDHKSCNLIRGDGIGLMIYPETEEFKLYYNVDLAFVLDGGKCGSFMNDKHFKLFEDKIVKYAYILRNYKNVMI